jgi:hypothetical protein
VLVKRVFAIRSESGLRERSVEPLAGLGISVGSQARTENYGLTQSPSSSTDVAYQDVYGLVSGQTYVLSAWVRASSATSNQVALAVANGASWMQNAVTPGTGWQQVSQSFTVASDGWMRIHLYQLGGSETVYWDDVTITPSRPMPACSHMSAVCVVQDNAGRLQAFALGTDGNVYINFEETTAGPWNGWSNFGGNIIAATPTVVQDSEGRLQAFVLGIDGTVYINYWLSANGPWSGWTNFGGGIITATPTVIQDNAGRLQVFALGNDGNVYVNFEQSTSGPWSGWSNFGGSVIAATPTVIQDNAGRLQMFALGSDGNVYTNYWLSANGPWSGWSNFGGGIIASAPTAVQDNAGRFDKATFFCKLSQSCSGGVKFSILK